MNCYFTTAHPQWENTAPQQKSTAGRCSIPGHQGNQHSHGANSSNSSIEQASRPTMAGMLKNQGETKTPKATPQEMSRPTTICSCRSTEITPLPRCTGSPARSQAFNSRVKHHPCALRMDASQLLAAWAARPLHLTEEHSNLVRFGPCQPMQARPAGGYGQTRRARPRIRPDYAHQSDQNALPLAGVAGILQQTWCSSWFPPQYYWGKETKKDARKRAPFLLAGGLPYLFNRWQVDAFKLFHWSRLDHGWFISHSRFCGWLSWLRVCRLLCRGWHLWG